MDRLHGCIVEILQDGLKLSLLVLSEIEPGREKFHLGFDRGDAVGIGHRGGIAGGLLRKRGDSKEQKRSEGE